MALLNLVVNVRDTPRVGDKLAILTRNIEGTVLGSIGWLKRRNLASSDQSQIGGLPIGVSLKVDSEFPQPYSAVEEWRFEAAVPLATHREGELKRGSLEERSLTRDRGFESVSLQKRV